MDEETCQVTLSSMMERISRLENDLRELRQLVLLQKPYLGISMHKPLTISTKSDLHSPTVVGDSWEVTCLGNFRLRYAGRDLALCKSRRGQSILKYLLASPEYAASSEMLIECFWPQVDPEAGVHSLQVAVHALRRSLRGCGPNGSDETVLFGNNRYFLNPCLIYCAGRGSFSSRLRTWSTCCSVPGNRLKRNRRLRRLAPSTPATITRIAMRSGHRVAALASSIRGLPCSVSWDLCIARGRNGNVAISCYHEILVVDCYREDIYRQLMRCYAACGRQADVKRTYRTCLEHLRRDLRLAPAPETTMLYQQLIQQTASLDAN